MPALREESKNPLDRLGTAIVAPPPRDNSPGQAALADFLHDL